MTQAPLSIAAAHAMLYESVAVGTDAEGVESTVELQTQLHDMQRDLSSQRQNAYRLHQDLQDAAIKEQILIGKLRTRSKAAASVHKAMLADLLALRSQLQFYYEQQQNNTNNNNSHNARSSAAGSPSSADAGNISFSGVGGSAYPVGLVQDFSGPPLGAPYDYASYLDVGRLLEGDSDGMGVDDSSYLPSDVLLVQRMLFADEVDRIQKNLVTQKQHIRSACELRMATTEAKIRQMRVQFQEACRVQLECETRISDAQHQAQLRIQENLESAAAATSEYVKKFRDEAEATIDQLSVKVSDVTMLLETAQAQNEVLTDRVERLQNTKKGLAAKQIAELEQNLDLLYRQVISKEEDIAAAKKQLKEAQSALEAQQQRSDILQEELRRRSDVIEEQDQTISDMKRDKERVVRQCKADIEQAKAAMEEEITKRVAEAAIDPEELESKIREIEELKDALKDSEKEAATLSTQLSDARESKRQQTVSNLATVEGLEAAVQLHQDRCRDAQSTVEALERKLQASADELLASQRAPPPRPSFGDAIIQMQRVSMELIETARSEALPKLQVVLDVVDAMLPEGSACRQYLADAHSAALTATNSVQSLLRDAQLLLSANCESPGDMLTDASTLQQTIERNQSVLTDALHDIPLDGLSKKLSTSLVELSKREAEDARIVWTRKRGERANAHGGGASAAWGQDSAAATTLVSPSSRSPRKSQKSPRKSSTGLAASARSPTTSPLATPTLDFHGAPLSPQDFLSASASAIGGESGVFGDEVLASSTRSVKSATSTKKTTGGGPKSILSSSTTKSQTPTAAAGGKVVMKSAPSAASSGADGTRSNSNVNSRRRSSTGPGGNSLASFPDEDAVGDDNTSYASSYARGGGGGAALIDAAVQWEDQPHAAPTPLARQASTVRGGASSSSSSLLRRASSKVVITSGQHAAVECCDVAVETDPVFVSELPTIAALQGRSTSTTDLLGQLVDATTSVAGSSRPASRPASAASTTLIRGYGGRPGSAGSIVFGNDGMLVMGNNSSTTMPMQHASTSPMAALPPPPPPDPVSEIHRLVAELQEQGPIAPMVVPRALRRDNTIALLQLLAPAEREEFSALAEQLELIPPRVRHVTVQRDSTQDPTNRQRRLEEQQAALEARLCTPQSSRTAAVARGAPPLPFPVGSSHEDRIGGYSGSDDETTTSAAHDDTTTDGGHSDQCSGALVVAPAAVMVPATTQHNQQQQPHAHAHRSPAGAAHDVGGLLHGLIGTVPSFLHEILERVVTPSSTAGGGQTSHVGLFCQRSLWQVASLLTAAPFEGGDHNKHDPLHAAFTRATRPIADATSPSTVLYRDAAIAARWCHVLLWSLELCRQQVESAAAEMDRWSMPPAGAAATSTSADSSTRSKHQSSGVTPELSTRPHSAMSSAILRREHQSGAAILPRPIMKQTPMRVGVARGQTASPSQLDSSPVHPTATWSSAADRLNTMHDQHRKFFENSNNVANLQSSQSDLLSDHLAFVAASAAPNVAVDVVKQVGRQVGRNGGLSIGGSTAGGGGGGGMYRYGRADVAAAGRMLPRQFTAEFDCAVRQTLVTPLEYVVGTPTPDGENVTTSMLPPRPNSAIPSMVGSKLRLSLHANSTYHPSRQQAAQEGGKHEGVSDDDEGGVDEDAGAEQQRRGRGEATEWTAENALYDDFVKHRRLERAVLAQVNGGAAMQPTIRCGSAPLSRHGSAGGKRVAAVDAPSTSSTAVVVYHGNPEQPPRSSSPPGDPAVGKEAQLAQVHAGGVRPGRTLKAVYSHQPSAGKRPPTPTQSRSLNELSYVQQPLPLPEVLPVESGLAPAGQSSRPGSSSLRDKLRTAIKDESMARGGASISASLTSITPAQNATQRRTVPPASVFQWQRIVNAAEPPERQLLLPFSTNETAPPGGNVKPLPSALRNIPQRNSSNAPSMSQQQQPIPGKSSAAEPIAHHTTGPHRGTTSVGASGGAATTYTGGLLLSSPTAAGASQQPQRRGGAPAAAKPPAGSLNKKASVEDSIFAAIGTTVHPWSINPDLENSAGFHFHPDEDDHQGGETFAVPASSFALT